MRWLIDGYNVIRRDPDLRAREAESLAAGRAALLHLVARVARESGDDFTVVFDGARPSGGTPSGGESGARVQVIFSRPPQKADDVLMKLAAQWREGAILVSSDRTIQDAARRAGGAVLAADEFLAGLESPEGEAGVKDDDEPDRGRSKRGNPRRLSKAARAAQRALRRLRPR